MKSFHRKRRESGRGYTKTLNFTCSAMRKPLKVSELRSYGLKAAFNEDPRGRTDKNSSCVCVHMRVFSKEMLLGGSQLQGVL